MSNNYYNKNLQPFANNLRKAMTKAEACLWKYALKSRKIKGYGFRRQRPVLNYIADFMCPELQLIIEVDGYSHSIDNIIENDTKRQNELESAGYFVLRFTDDEVLKDMVNVIMRIEAVVEKLEKANASNPPPTPAYRQAGPPAGDIQIHKLRNNTIDCRLYFCIYMRIIL